MTHGASLRRRAWLVAWVSAAVLGFEIVLMRVLLVVSWHHFAFLVISIALLGFGASGTLLTLARNWLLPRGDGALLALSVLALVSMPICVGAAQHVPVEARFAPALIWKQAGAWLLFWLLLFVPFLLGAAAIGLALMLSRDRIALVYAANLLGSGAGAIGAMLAMSHVPVAWLPVAMAGLGLPGVAGSGWRRKAHRLGALALAVVAVCAFVALDPPSLRVDPYKYGAFVQRLEAQGAARCLAVASSPRGVVEVYRGDAFHELPFLSMDAALPVLDVIVVDGHWAGSAFRAGTPEGAEAARKTLMSVPYALLEAPARVLLLGEVGGANAWLARLSGATAIDVVQPDGALLDLLRGPLAREGGAFLDLPGVRPVEADPRHFVEHVREPYDLVQLVAFESSAAGSGGVGGLAESHLLTVEGIEACLGGLRPGGAVSVCRGIQVPPRDNLKLLATIVAALRGLEVEAPEGHVVIVRDYLAVCTLVRRTPWTAEEIERVAGPCAERGLTPVWFPGIRAEEMNRPDVLPGPGGAGAPGSADWFAHAATQLFSPEADAFIAGWTYDVRPPRDERPFFLDFCRLGSIGALRAAYGDLWLTRAELAFLFVLTALGAVAVAGALLTVLPVLALRAVRGTRGKGSAAAYFGAIGLGYLLLEMVVISRMTHLVGDPVRAAAATITTFLVCSGLGSLAAQRLTVRSGTWARRVILGLLVVGLLEIVLALPLARGIAGGLSLVPRAAIGMVVIAPLAVLMGFPMPTGLARLERGAPVLLPWAWGVNGFTSVLAAPLALVLAMTWGYEVTAGAALVAYGVAALVLSRLPDTS